jgi:arabinose-5-phosphate isomerase
MSEAKMTMPADTAPAIVSAQRTLATELSGVEAVRLALAGPLGVAFEAAIALIRQASGRVIVSGMGKSGHVGVKIAATLASTGTPAFFVHPAEASHGDLGMVTPDDVILALSYSGETAELRNLVAYSRRFKVPLVAMTGRADSTLAGASDVALLLPPVNEACPHGLAPTTSALVQLVLGDALAIALLEAHGFTAGDFHTFHPGGTLGASLTHVGDIMHSGEALPVVSSGTPISDAVAVITDKGFGCVLVVGPAGQLAGIVTDGDLRRLMAGTANGHTVDDVMSTNPRTIGADMLAAAALEVVNSAAITALIVVEDGRPVGLVHLHDLLRLGAA